MAQLAVQFSSHNCPTSRSLEEYARKKLVTIERHFNQIIDVKFTFDVLADRRHKASVMIHVPVKKTLHADQECENMYTAIDKMMDKMDKLVRDHKEKMRSHHE
ncbi:ribosome-associated translation inhibitor RaiA [Gammaproteobacteria bacterium]|nr:ribosome-associated translation inhibitor RaiA [Gammaproteobacteria bacterium]